MAHFIYLLGISNCMGCKTNKIICVQTNRASTESDQIILRCPQYDYSRFSRVNSRFGNFARILFSRIALKSYECCEKFATKARFTFSIKT